jgi:AraC-like DNA-binding protein
LRPFVTAYSGYRQTAGPPGTHRGLPSPYCTFIVTLDDPLLVGTDGEVRSYDALVAGLHTTSERIVHPGRQSGVQMALTPLGARALLGVRASELARVNEHAEAVLGDSIRVLREQLLAASTWGARFAALDRWLLARANLDAALPPGVDRAWRLLGASGGTTSIADVAGAVYCSTRHLRGVMLAETGLGPKTAARIVRFDRARHRLREAMASGGGDGLAQVAAASGYADQAHFTREFRDFAGCTPSSWLAEEFPFLQARLAVALPE